MLVKRHLLGRRQRERIMLPNPSTGGARRSRERQPRQHKITARLSDAELAAITAEADQADLALAAYIIRAAMDAAEHRAVPVPEIQREMLAALIEVAGLMRRAGANLNQAVARLNATGVPGPDLVPAANYCARAIRRADETVALVRRGLR
jgi:hypothetical protein